jgi:hypothetical protein
MAPSAKVPPAREARIRKRFSQRLAQFEPVMKKPVLVGIVGKVFWVGSAGLRRFQKWNVHRMRILCRKCCKIRKLSINDDR